MKLNDLYRFADEQNIEVLTYPMRDNGSMSVMDDDGSCYVGMDESVQDGSLQEQVHLAHELGHCATGGFYNRYSPHDLRQKHERKADAWAIRQLIPETELIEAVCAGITDLWELADLFDVTAEFMQKAVCYYQPQ
jgi:hypothetical protein